MILAELLSGMEPANRVRIGAANGSSWFFSGTIGSINWDALNRFAMSRNQSNVSRSAFVPVQNREVVDKFVSMRNDDVLNILVRGFETAKLEDDTITMDLSSLNDRGVVNIAIAIIRHVTNRLRNAYEEYDRTANPFIRSIWQEKINTYEKFLRGSDIVDLIGSSADGIIREARKERQSD